MAASVSDSLRSNNLTDWVRYAETRDPALRTTLIERHVEIARKIGRASCRERV